MELRHKYAWKLKWQDQQVVNNLFINIFTKNDKRFNMYCSHGRRKTKFISGVKLPAHTRHTMCNVQIWLHNIVLMTYLQCR